MHRNRQQCLVAKWLGLSVTVRVWVRARNVFFPSFFFSLLKVICLVVTATFVA